MQRHLTISKIHAGYAQGRHPDQVMRQVFDAIERIADPGIFISLVSRDRIKAAIAALGPFDLAAKPLWGIPFAVKDNIDVAGLPTTAACPAFSYEPARSAHVVERLVEAGAIVVGKTNLDQFATGLVGIRTPFPAPRNALDPSLVPGGSSSGSAVAVAHGIVPFALGTDTAGSGRIPAGLNNIVGLKPSLGALSCVGVVPACRTLDCVSVFALTVDDAFDVAAIANGLDAEDPFSRPCPFVRGGVPVRLRIGVPDAVSRQFFGDGLAAAAFDAACTQAVDLGAEIVACDMSDFQAAAALLYSGPWVAERYQAIREFIEQHAVSLHPVTRSIISAASGITAADAFAGMYRLAVLRRRTEAIWNDIDALMVPTAPTHYSVEQVLNDPLTTNSRLGTYTNFVNLLDLCALAVPGPMRGDARPAGITLIAPRGRDGMLANVGSRLHAAVASTLGATGAPLPPARATPAAAPPGWIEIVCVGAHMMGLPLNGELTRLSGVFVRSVSTAPCYRLHALAGGPPARPGMVRVAEDQGTSIETEIWALPAAAFSSFVGLIPSPLGLATIFLADGTRALGFIVEVEGRTGAEDISAYGGWRAYLRASGVAGGTPAPPAQFAVDIAD